MMQYRRSCLSHRQKHPDLVVVIIPTKTICLDKHGNDPIVTIPTSYSASWVKSTKSTSSGVLLILYHMEYWGIFPGFKAVVLLLDRRRGVFPPLWYYWSIMSPNVSYFSMFQTILLLSRMCEVAVLTLTR